MLVVGRMPVWELPELVALNRLPMRVPLTSYPTAAAARAALIEGKPALVWRTCVSDTETPVSAFLKLSEEGRGDFLLESVEGGAVRGRYSLLGLAPDLVFRANGEAVWSEVEALLNKAPRAH